MKKLEIQFDLKPNGAVIRINDYKGCILRICGIPKELVFDNEGKVKEFVDIAYPNKFTEDTSNILCQHVDRSKKNDEGNVIVATLSTTGNIVASEEVLDFITKNVDIRAPQGTKVKLLMKDGEIFGGYDGDKKQALRYLKPDTIYHIKRTDVQTWTTDIYLEEFPEHGFNSVMFEHIKD